MNNNLELFTLSKDLMIEIHKMTLELSKMDILWKGQAVHESFTSVTTIAASHIQKRYKPEIIKSLVHHHACRDNEHLEALFEKGKLTRENLIAALKIKLEKMAAIINGLRQFEETGKLHP